MVLRGGAPENCYEAPKGPFPKVVKPGHWPRSRWEINGYSSKATPLINCSNWQDALKKEATFQYKWSGIIKEDKDAPDWRAERTGYWHEKQPPESQRSWACPPIGSPTLAPPIKFTETGSPIDPSWDKKVVEKLLFNTQRTAFRHAKDRLQKKARSTLPEREVNIHQAYRTPMPGYTGNRPLVRSPFENCHKNGLCKGQAAELYTVTKRDFNGFDVPGLNNLEHKRERDAHVDYRMMCCRYLGKGSPYLNEPGVVIPKRFNMQMSDNEYISRSAEEIQKIAARNS